MMSKIMNYQALGLALRNARKQAGLSQEEAAHRINAARTTMIAIEQGN